MALCITRSIIRYIPELIGLFIPVKSMVMAALLYPLDRGQIFTY